MGIVTVSGRWVVGLLGGWKGSLKCGSMGAQVCRFVGRFVGGLVGDLRTSSGVLGVAVSITFLQGVGDHDVMRCHDAKWGGVP